jgi:hypothetical protein
MKSKVKDVAVERGDEIEQLRKSPIREVPPISSNPIDIPIDKIGIDPTNPGADEAKSLRYKRRAGSIRDSVDIIGSVVYPIVVCQKPDDPTRYIHVDGYGRLSELRNRGVKTIRAFVFPPLSLEQRICLRETLNAAQEPFDAVSVVRDLWQLAAERGLSLDNPEQVKTLVRDLPEKVRKFQRDLIMLGQWHPKAVAKLGESYEEDGQAIGIDKIRGLNSIIRVVRERHPKVLKRLGGDRDLSLTLAQMYTDGKFRIGTRSQEAIRKVTRNIKDMREDHDKVFEFFDQQQSWTALPSSNGKSNVASPDLLKRCQDFMTALLEVEDASTLSVKERRALERTDTVLGQVLGQS